MIFIHCPLCRAQYAETCLECPCCAPAKLQKELEWMQAQAKRKREKKA